MTSSRISAAALRAGLASLAAGLVVIAAAQVLAPLDRPPLYDGVVVEEPYRYLAPGPGQAGDPTSYAGTEPVIGPASPAFAAATAEGPPQAQLIAQAGAFSIPEEATGMAVTIMPVAPEPPGAIPGNAYRFSVTDEAGAPVPVATGSFVTLLLRAPTGLTEVTIVQLVDGGWTPVPTLRAGEPDAYDINVDVLGVFAIQGTVAPVGTDPGPLVQVVGILAALGTLIVAVSLVPTLLKRSAPAAPAAQPEQPRPGQPRPTQPRAEQHSKRRRGRG